MWISQGDLHRARNWFNAAHRRLPPDAPAAAYVADVEAVSTISFRRTEP
jgi:hypothetical protein